MTSARIDLITGVSREMGLGYETARQLAARGDQVIITARNGKAAEALARNIGVQAMELDVTQDWQVKRLASDLTSRFGKLDVLINNAGAYFDMGNEPLSADMNFVREAFDTNLLGAWRMIKALVPLLRKSEGARIVNVSSGAGSFTDPVFGLAHRSNQVPVYSLTKMALNGLTVVLARQLEGTLIKVNAVCPGFVATYPGTAEWGAIPVAEGVSGIVWAATLPNDGPSGGFFRDKKALGW